MGSSTLFVITARRYSQGVRTVLLQRVTYISFFKAEFLFSGQCQSVAPESLEL